MKTHEFVNKNQQNAPSLVFPVQRNNFSQYPQNFQNSGSLLKTRNHNQVWYNEQKFLMNNKSNNLFNPLIHGFPNFVMRKKEFLSSDLNLKNLKSDSFQNEKIQKQIELPSRKKSTFFIGNKKIIHRIFQNHFELDESFGKNFGTPKINNFIHFNVQKNISKDLSVAQNDSFQYKNPRIPIKKIIERNNLKINSQKINLKYQSDFNLKRNLNNQLNPQFIFNQQQNLNSKNINPQMMRSQYSQLNQQNFNLNSLATPNTFKNQRMYLPIHLPKVESSFLETQISPYQRSQNQNHSQIPNFQNLKRVKQFPNTKSQFYKNQNEKINYKKSKMQTPKQNLFCKIKKSEINEMEKHSTHASLDQDPDSTRFNQTKTSIVQAKEEKIAKDQQVGLIKLQTKKFDQKNFQKDLQKNFTEIEKLDLASDLLIKPEPRGRLSSHKGKEFMVQCRGCECVVAKIDTARRNFFISTQDSRDIFANFSLMNVSPLVNKSDAYPLENLKKILISMLLRQKIQPQMLDLNIFEIKLLHAVLVKRFKSFYLNSKIKLKKNHRKILKSQSDLNSFSEFLETKRVCSGKKQGSFCDKINQKSIFYKEQDIEEIDKQQFTTVFLNILIENEPLKRLEEQLKFVLSRAEQSLIVEFLDQDKGQTPEQIDKSLKTNRYKVEVEFYQKYFSSFAKSNSIPIEKFYFPRNKNKLVSNSHKTINKSYMGNITLNPEYVGKMTKHIRDKLLNIEKETIKTKINNKIDKWNSFLLRKLNFEREEDIVEHFDNFINRNILENDKFKLPWSVKQIESAISTVLDQLS